MPRSMIGVADVLRRTCQIPWAQRKLFAVVTVPASRRVVMLTGENERNMSTMWD